MALWIAVAAVLLLAFEYIRKVMEVLVAINSHSLLLTISNAYFFIHFTNQLCA